MLVGRLARAATGAEDGVAAAARRVGCRAMRIAATTDAPLATSADTIAVGVFDGEDVAHDVGDGTLQRLLDRGEARRAFKHLAVAHAEDRRFVVVGLGARDEFDAERARIAAAA